MVAISAGKSDATIPAGYAMPIAADWDGDGVWDLISGSKDGSVHWFRNAGKAGKPRLEARRVLVKRAERGTDSGPLTCAQVDVADFDGDGDMDLLVGDQSAKTSNGKRVRHGFVWFYRRSNVNTDQAKNTGRSGKIR